tara:strand:- start:4904 stop:7243 length:2340 start_codon:yes stop_codon:yes gene_type:complete
MSDLIAITKSIADKVKNGLDAYIKHNNWIDVVESPKRFNELKYFILSSEINKVIDNLLPAKGLDINSNDGYLTDYIQLHQNYTAFYNNYNDEVEVRSFLDLGKIYESLISIDFHIDKGSIKYNFNNIKRNIQGAYFTPYELAISATRSMINDWYLKHPSIEHIQNLKIADLSCGIGIFLIAFIDQLELFLKEKGLSSSKIRSITDKVCINATCVDIDFLALDISRFIICERDNFRHIPKKSNFMLGNPLVIAKEGDIPQKLNSFVTGKYYENGNGLDLDGYEFDIVLGNPPWEKIRLEERSFFAPFLCPSFKFTTKKERVKSIQHIEENYAELFSFYNEAIDSYLVAKKKIKNTHMFKSSSIGELNTYILFTDLALAKTKGSGIVSLLVKTSILTSSVNKKFIENIVSTNKLYRVSDFINKKSIFSIDNRERFCLLTLTQTSGNYFLYAGLLEQAEEVVEATYWRYPYSYLKMLNPKTGVMTTFSNDDELEITVAVNKSNSNFDAEFNHAHYGRLVHYTNHSEYLSTTPSEQSISVIEGKFISIFDGRFSTYNGVDEGLLYTSKAKSRQMSIEDKSTNIPQSRYFIDREKWLSLSKNYKENHFLAWRAMSSSSNSRTCIATLLNFQPSSQSIQFLQLKDPRELIYAVTIMNSMTFDYLLRRKLAGIDVTQTLIKQVSIPPLSKFKQQVSFEDNKLEASTLILSIVRDIYSHEERLNNLFQSFAFNHVRTDISDKVSFLDALVAKLYGIKFDQYKTIISDFKAPYNVDYKLKCFNQITLN